MGGIMLNWDDTAYEFYIYSKYGTAHRSREDSTASMLTVVDQYRGTPVSDFIMAVSGRMADVKSEYRESFSGKYLQKTENGHAVDYRDSLIAVFYDEEVVNGLDKYRIWSDRLNEIGIHPWASYRMNDAHSTFEETSFLDSDYWHAHPELRRVNYRKPAEYFDKIYDWANPQVREKMAEYIAETVERWDLYGVELDWQREIFCFRPGGEYDGRRIITDFTREIRHMLDAEAAVKGHAIKLTARVPASPEVAFYSGFDAVAWAREGLIDSLTVTPRWSTTDFDMPVELWRQILPENVGLNAGIEIIARETETSEVRKFRDFNTPQTVAAAASQYYAAGADKIYLFNYMHFTGNDAAAESSALLDRNYLPMLASIRDPESASSSPRRHLMTFRDGQPFWSSDNQQLPRVCRRSDIPEKFRLRCGPVTDRTEAVLKFEFSPASARPEVFVNGEKTAFVRSSETGTEYIVDPCVLRPVNTVEVLSGGDEFTVGHLELDLDIGE